MVVLGANGTASLGLAMANKPNPLIHSPRITHAQANEQDQEAVGQISR